MPHCSLFKVICPKQPTGIPSFLLSQGLCLRHLCLVSPSSPCLGLHGVYSPTAPIAPSFRPLVLSGFLIGCQSVQVHHHHPAFLIDGGKLLRVAGAPTSLALTVCAVFSFILEGADPLHNILMLIFHSLMEVLAICFAISSSTVFLKV
jgi:hypothetical protein